MKPKLSHIIKLAERIKHFKSKSPKSTTIQTTTEDTDFEEYFEDERYMIDPNVDRNRGLIGLQEFDNNFGDAKDAELDKIYFRPVQEKELQAIAPDSPVSKADMHIPYKFQPTQFFEGAQNLGIANLKQICEQVLRKVSESHRPNNIEFYGKSTEEKETLETLKKIGTTENKPTLDPHYYEEEVKHENEMGKIIPHNPVEVQKPSMSVPNDTQSKQQNEIRRSYSTNQNEFLIPGVMVESRKDQDQPSYKGVKLAQPSAEITFKKYPAAEEKVTVSPSDAFDRITEQLRSKEKIVKDGKVYDDIVYLFHGMQETANLPNYEDVKIQHQDLIENLIDLESIEIRDVTSPSKKLFRDPFKRRISRINYDLKTKGTLTMQAVRSASDWSIGLTETEHSIQNCYVQLIKDAERFVYIENQFFISSWQATNESNSVRNRIAKAIYDRIYQAHTLGQDFKVIVFIPLLPAAEGNLNDRGGKVLQVLMALQNFTIGEGKDSLMKKIEALCGDSSKYFMICGLRKWQYRPKRDANGVEQIDPITGLVMEDKESDPVTQLIYVHSKVVLR
jgi:hypothetical protein